MLLSCVNQGLHGMDHLPRTLSSVMPLSSTNDGGSAVVRAVKELCSLSIHLASIYVMQLLRTGGVHRVVTALPASSTSLALVYFCNIQ
jgi:hypothetical protein